jgi:hypothetical protein
MLRLRLLPALICLLATCAFAQAPTETGTAAQQSGAQNTVAQSEAPVAMEDARKLVAAQFGPGFTLKPGFAPISADLDGDGAEELVLVGTAKDPLIDELSFGYKTIDPYNTYFGFGDPRVTMQFVAQEGEPRYLLVLHSWQAAQPKAKFVIINLPFAKISIARVMTGKKKKRVVIPAISLEDRTGMTSDLFWNGKQWKWMDKSLSIE